MERTSQPIADGFDRSAVVLLELMANCTDANNVTADFKRGNESGAPERNNQFALLVVSGASGLAT